jgi:ribosomal protein S18 acetylase RimI-like enzyme
VAGAGGLPVSDIRYRDATPRDAQAIAQVFARTFIDTFGHLYREEDLSEFLAGKSAAHFAEELADPHYRFRLAEEDGRLAGYVKLGPPELPVETPPDTIELCQLYVLKDWHGAGIARALMDWTIGQAHALNAEHIQLSVYVENHRARRLYERYGFHPVGRYDFMVGSHADEDIVLRHTVMQRDE